MDAFASGVFRFQIVAASIDKAFVKGESCGARLAFAVGLLVAIVLLQIPPANAAAPIKVETQNLLVSVDAADCRWSAEVKGTPMRMNEVYFLPGDDPSGWKVTSSVNNADSNKFGSFVTVTLRGTKPGQLDFEYQISASKTGNDILVSLGRSNKTGKAVDVEDMDYFVSSDARLGGSTEKWTSLGTMSQNREYYDLGPGDQFHHAQDVRR